MKYIKKFILLLVMTIIFSLHLFSFNPINDIKINYKIYTLKNDEYKILLKFKINGNVHIQKNDLFNFNAKNESVKIKNIKYPASEKWEGSDVYKNKFIVTLFIKNLNKISSFPLQINYQCCDEETKVCYLPTQRIININFKKAEENKNNTIESKIENALQTNLPLAFLLVFIGGILASLTPCVYPIIPITIGYIGSKSRGSKYKGFILSIFFVLGLSITYSILGIIAAATGSVFGSLMQTPVVITGISLIFIAMALSMFGLYDIQLPPSITAKLQSGGSKHKGFIGSFLIGMITGLIAAPCVGPIIISLLAWIAKTGSLFLGFWLLFIFAWGMGILFILVGTFAGILNNMPKSGKWMEYIKYFFGILLLGTAFYYLKIVINPHIYKILIGITLITGGVYVYKKEKKFSEVIKYLLIIFGMFYIFYGLSNLYGINILNQKRLISNNKKELIYDYINDDKKAFLIAKKENKLLFIDFYADWCVECKELEEKTYINPEVQKVLKNFIKLKMDFTKNNDWAKRKRDEYKIQGLPTVIFFTPAGKEIKRFYGYKDSKEFLNIIKNLNKNGV